MMCVCVKIYAEAENEFVEETVGRQNGFSRTYTIIIISFIIFFRSLWVQVTRDLCTPLIVTVTV